MSKKTVTIALVLVLALATLGVGYGYWSQQLNIGGTVQTGDLDVKLDFTGVIETDPLAAANCAVSPNNDHNDGFGPDVLTVTVTGAYPGYRCQVQFRVVNAGTIPVAVSVPYDNPNSNPDWEGLGSCYVGGSTIAVGGDSGNCEIDIVVPVTPGDVPENSGPYTFNFTIDATQPLPQP